MTPLLRLTALAATLALAAAARSCETHAAADLSARNRFIASADDEACIYEMGEAAAVVGKVCIDTPSGATPTHAVLNDRTAFLFLERDDGPSSQVVAYNEQEDGRYVEGAVAWAEAHSEASMARAESLLVVIGDQAGDCVVRAIPYNSTDGETGTATDIILAENSTCAVGGATAVTVDVDGTTILALDGAGGNESAALVLSRVDELDWELGGYYYYEEDEAGVLHAAVLSPGLFALAEEDALSILAPGNQTQQQQPEGLRVEATVGLDDAPTFLAAADDGTLVLCGRDNCSRYELAAGALTASSAFAPAGGLGCSAAYKRQGSFFVALTAAGDEIAFEDAAGARATIPAPSATAAPTTAEAAIKPRRDAGPSAIVWTLGCAFAAACIALALVIVWRRRRRYQQHQKVSTAAEFSAQRAY